MKSHYSSTILSWRCKQYNPEESRLLPVETVPLPTRLDSGTQNLPFASFSPLTTEHYDRYMLTVAKIIDLFMCLEVCCHV